MNARPSVAAMTARKTTTASIFLRGSDHHRGGRTLDGLEIDALFRRDLPRLLLKLHVLDKSTSSVLNRRDGSVGRVCVACERDDRQGCVLDCWDGRSRRDAPGRWRSLVTHETLDIVTICELGVQVGETGEIHRLRRGRATSATRPGSGNLRTKPRGPRFREQELGLALPHHRLAVAESVGRDSRE